MRFVRALGLLVSIIPFAVAGCSDGGGGCTVADECAQHCAEECAETSVAGILCTGGACVCRCAEAQ